MDAGFFYREAAVQGASPVQLVICLYEQAMEDIRRAILAMERREIEERTRLVNHALKVLGQLQGTLNMQQGGAVAANLQRFYNGVRTCLIEAHHQQSSPMLQRQLAQLATVHEAWLEVERASSASIPVHEARPLAEKPAPEIRLSDWNA